MPLVRVESLRPARLTTAWLDADGEPVAPAEVAFSAAPVAGGAPTTASCDVEAGLATAALAAGQLAPLTRYTATWDGGPDGKIVHDVATVAGSAFSLPELRASDDRLEDAERYPARVLRAARDAALDALEDACGVAFARRQEVEASFLERDRAGSWPLLLGWPELHEVQSLTIDGLEAPFRTLRGGLLQVTATASAGARLRVVYTHGMAAIPARVSTATLRMSVDALVNGPADDRVSAMRQPDSPFLQFVTAGVAGARFSTPEANAVVETYRYPHRGTR